MQHYLILLMILISSFVFGNERQLIVTGNATLKKPADQLNIDIGVVTQDENAQKALSNNSERAQAVIKALESLGITNKEYQTGRFSIRPLFSRPPKNIPPDWVAKINGYEVTNSVSVRTDKIKLAGNIIDAANSAGANSIDNIRFDLSDSRQFRSEAIQAATSYAKSDAQALADAASVKLVKIVQINLDQARVNPLRSERGMFLQAKAFDAGPPIEPGDVDVRAEVTLVYEIE